jgi:SAM-dependent methyltransferase
MSFQTWLKAKTRSNRVVYALYGWCRYAVFHANLLWLTLREKRRADGPEPRVPPPLLRFRVHGALDGRSFLTVGQQCAEDIRRILQMEGQDLYSFRRVLDFACGCGRVARNFADHPQRCLFYGSDIDQNAIAWCRGALSHMGQWDVNDYSPPTQYAPGTFDFIYVISLFTHLDEKQQFDWLGELRRISRPGGLLLLTAHGPYAQKDLPAEDVEVIENKGFLFVPVYTGRLKLDGLPDTYQTAFHSKSYIGREWTKYFSIVRYVEQGINSHQDAILLRNDRT